MSPLFRPIWPGAKLLGQKTLLFLLTTNLTVAVVLLNLTDMSFWLKSIPLLAFENLRPYCTKPVLFIIEQVTFCAIIAISLKIGDRGFHNPINLVAMICEQSWSGQ